MNNNCYSHNSTTTHVCTKLDCKYKLACNTCVNQQHIGHVDLNVIPLKKFVDRILYEFQRSEVDRLKRVNYKEDIVQHIQREFKYLKEKTSQILNQREIRLLDLLDKQWIHGRSLKNIIDHIEMMSDGKVYEDGMQIVLPILAKGTQEVISKYERDKIRIVTKIKDQINQVKTVLDGLFYVGNQYQYDQHQIAVENVLKHENSLKKSEDRLFQSAVHLSQPQPREYQRPYGTYQEFVDSLYPERQQEYVQALDYVSLLRPTQFEKQQLQFEKTENFSLFGVIDHSNEINSNLRMKNGQIVTCSKVVSIFEYPSLKMLHQINQAAKQVVEITPSLIALLTQSQVILYEKRNQRWMTKGEFLVPGLGVQSKIGVIANQLIILAQTQLFIYQLKKELYADQPIEYLFVSVTPQAYMHKYDCCSYAIVEDKLYTGDFGGRLYHWRLGNVFSVESVIQASNCEIVAIIPMHDGRTITVGVDGILRLWDETLQIVTTVKHRSSFTCAVAAKELDQFYTGDIRGKIQKWKVVVLIESLYELDAHSDSVSDLQYSNQCLITGSADKKTKVWLVSN